MVMVPPWQASQIQISREEDCMFFPRRREKVSHCLYKKGLRLFVMDPDESPLRPPAKKVGPRQAIYVPCAGVDCVIAASGPSSPRSQDDIRRASEWQRPQFQDSSGSVAYVQCPQKSAASPSEPARLGQARERATEKRQTERARHFSHFSSQASSQDSNPAKWV
ncbi:hypothetical protein VTK73DRAFT_3104 [Phialemonium thermophilum]|uniref:Uncharacterized protein n=1 Tax=Phialemonium thermophilum TaxID=223376 RepID=A0ABR3VLE0_9PEZI